MFFFFFLQMRKIIIFYRDLEKLTASNARLSFKDTVAFSQPQHGMATKLWLYNEPILNYLLRTESDGEFIELNHHIILNKSHLLNMAGCSRLIVLLQLILTVCNTWFILQIDHSNACFPSVIQCERNIRISPTLH